MKSTASIGWALTLIVGLLLMAHGDSAVAARPTAIDPQSSKSKATKGQTKHSTDKNRYNRQPRFSTAVRPVTRWSRPGEL